MFDFPSPATVGQTATAPNGASFVWDGAKWTTVANAAPNLSGPFLPLSGGTVTGPTTHSAAVTLSAGGSLAGTFAGTPTWSGRNTFSAGIAFSGGTGGPGTITSQANWGCLLEGNSGSVADIGLQASDGTVPVRITTGNVMQLAGSLVTTGQIGSQALSGSQTLTRLGNFGVNISGSSTATGNNYKFTIGSSSDALAAPGMSVFDLGITPNLAAGWQGSRGGINSYMVTTGTTNLTTSVAAGAGAIVSIGGAVTSNHNMGGVSSGYNSTQFGLGTQWAGVFQTILGAGSTYWTSSIGLEIDNAILSGGSSGWNIGLLLNLYPNSVVQGSLMDAALVINAAGTTKWNNGILIGSSQSHTIDPNGYFLRGLAGRDGSAPMTAAGGIDMLQPQFTGVGTGGGGFAFRTSNWQVLNSGAMQVGYGLLGIGVSGTTIDTTYQKVTAAAVSSGGSNFSVHDLLEGADGTLVTVSSVSGGVITGVTILETGWGLTGSLPSNPVAFTAQGRAGANVGSGCTLTLTWTPQTALQLQPSGGSTTVGGTARFNGNIGFNNTAPIAKPTVTGAKGSNAALASLLTALAAYGLVTDTTTA